MDRHFNKEQNKLEYFFSKKETIQLVDLLIKKKFLWNVQKYIFTTQYKQTNLEIRVNGRNIIIHNDKEIARIFLDSKDYDRLLLGIQDTVVQG